MDADRTDLVTEWEAESVSDGFAGLARLADRGFSGVVTDAAVRIYLLNGRIVGVTGGSLSAFEDASGTAYTAPDESLPLLFAMQTRGGEQKAQYYTNDTPISEADRTLSESNFTGYIELSENVLSGDYYVAYYGGESFPVAFIGNAEQLKTGTEAFELADDEVGIYRVHEVDLEVQDVPEPAAAAGSAVSGRGSFADTTSESETFPTEEDSLEGGASSESGRTDAAGSSETADPVDATEPADATEPTETDDAAEVTDTSDGAVTMGKHGEPGSGSNGSHPDESHSDESHSDGRPPTETSGAGDAAATGATADDAETGTGADEASAGSRSEPDPRPRRDRGSTETRNATQRSETAPSADATPAGETTAADADARQRENESRQGENPQRQGENPQRQDDDPTASENVFSQEAEWREAKSIPSIDPSETRANRQPTEADDAAPNEAAASGSARSGTDRREPRSTDDAAGTQRSATTRRSAADTDSKAAAARDQRRSASGTGSGTEGRGAAAGDLRNRIERLENELAKATDRRDQLEADRDRLENERDELAAERDDIAAERDEIATEAERLQERVEELESTLDRVRGELEEARAQLPEGDRVLSPADALAGTNLFVRYDSKGGATLEKAHNGSVEREELVDNLRIEHHTSFEDERVVVNGQPYREFLVETMEFGFTNWVVTELLFEIRDTGNVSGLQDLYDAIPRIDRAEIGGSVSLTYESEGEEHREQQTFDLVLRDRMGNPLIVADLNDGRDPTPEGTLEGLVETGSQLAEGTDEFTAGVAVTSSFFDPGALEAAEDATGGGLLSRSKKRNFVKVARKRGFHLCLAESREHGFHLTVPEL
ncbi:hypothetical protein SAMN05192561_101699 [Halopenitus malekzadehii]|uniref:DUF7527 domain-containing protein n=1 Tax=Halopenitus malekzadehii TaxID=1267564 RepID=A0A1H6HXW8_9EURY|nr:hypothetical protein [Halopenitus malekzadehii]SEH40840.1 hypothetical protein SAMN05192561_101699 [Halopenitus malekzadehii]